MAFQFEELSSLTQPRLALFWGDLREDYPSVEEQLPLPPISDALAQSSRARVALEVLTEVKPARLWFLDASSSKLIQLQTNRVGYNWRRVSTDVSYPSFESVSTNFKGIISKLINFVGRELDAAIKPTHCEIVYVNHFLLSETDSAGDLGRVVSFWSENGPAESFGMPEDAGCFFRYPLEGICERPGRITLEVKPGLRRADRAPLLMMNTIVQMELSGQDWATAWADLDLGHEAAGRLFLEATHRQLQQTWGRTG